MKKINVLIGLMLCSQLGNANSGATGIVYLISFLFIMANISAILMVYFSLYLRVKYEHIVTIALTYFLTGSFLLFSIGYLFYLSYFGEYSYERGVQILIFIINVFISSNVLMKNITRDRKKKNNKNS